jgi:hypothetical protein
MKVKHYIFILSTLNVCPPNLFRQKWQRQCKHILQGMVVLHGRKIDLELHKVFIKGMVSVNTSCEAYNC